MVRPAPRAQRFRRRHGCRPDGHRARIRRRGDRLRSFCVAVVVTSAPPPSSTFVAGHVAVAVTVVFRAAFAPEVTGVPVIRCDPDGPAGPAGPVAPVAPVAPVGPAGPAGPCWSAGTGRTLWSRRRPAVPVRLDRPARPAALPALADPSHRLRQVSPAGLPDLWRLPVPAHPDLLAALAILEILGAPGAPAAPCGPDAPRGPAGPLGPRCPRRLPRRPCVSLGRQPDVRAHESQRTRALVAPAEDSADVRDPSLSLLRGTAGGADEEDGKDDCSAEHRGEWVSHRVAQRGHPAT